MSATAVTDAQFRDFVRARAYITEAEQADSSFVFYRSSSRSAALRSGRSRASCPGGFPSRGACWQRLAGPGSEIQDRLDHPVVHVSWHDAATSRAGKTYRVRGQVQPAVVVSHALLYGAVRLNAFESQRLADSDIRLLMAKTKLHADERLSASFPDVRAARVIVTLRDGEVIEQFAPYRKGDPEAPLSDAELNDKFLELASAVIGERPAQQLLAKLWAVDRVDAADLKLTQV